MRQLKRSQIQNGVIRFEPTETAHSSAAEVDIPITAAIQSVRQGGGDFQGMEGGVPVRGAHPRRRAQRCHLLDWTRSAARAQQHRRCKTQLTQQMTGAERQCAAAHPDSRHCPDPQHIGAFELQPILHQGKGEAYFRARRQIRT